MRLIALKLGATSMDDPVPILEKIKLRFFTFRLTFLNFSCLLISGFVTYKYMYTKNWMYNNVLAISFTIYFLDRMLVTNFKNAIIYLSGMMLYDIFWVFGSDVMVTVATQLDLPIKLVFPKDFNPVSGAATGLYVIGIGDIALPGIFVAMMLRFDFLTSVTQNKESFTIQNFEKLKDSLEFAKPYFKTSLVGYFLGLFL